MGGKATNVGKDVGNVRSFDVFLLFVQKRQKTRETKAGWGQKRPLKPHKLG